VEIEVLSSTELMNQVMLVEQNQLSGFVFVKRSMVFGENLANQKFEQNMQKMVTLLKLLMYLQELFRNQNNSHTVVLIMSLILLF
jgi:hypothetical protein